MEKKILFLDLDGTLIETANGKTFPMGIWDMIFKMDVFDKLKKFYIENDVLIVHIVSNQGGVELGYTSYGRMNSKIQYVARCLEEYIEKDSNLKRDVCVSYMFCYKNDKSDPNRKPNIGMLESAMKEDLGTLEDYDPSFEIELEGGRFLTFLNELYPDIDENKYKEMCLMIGDASGLPGQFSDSDKKCAENFGIDYMDVNDFLKS